MSKNSAGPHRSGLLASPLEFPQRGNSRSEKIFAPPTYHRGPCQLNILRCPARDASKKAKFGWGQILPPYSNEHLKIQNLAKSCEALAKQEKEQKNQKLLRGGNYLKALLVLAFFFS